MIRRISLIISVTLFAIVLSIELFSPIVTETTPKSNIGEYIATDLPIGPLSSKKPSI
ncbi:hypothetical protein [Tumebacillus lipolyticus]|uniref:Uncharacterized protein n=1 Tax=Tumebacillus lipolyticus TaxID=1280370 RepID=A0ABW4ZW07_9BACL